MESDLSSFKLAVLKQQQHPLQSLGRRFNRDGREGQTQRGFGKVLGACLRDAWITKKAILWPFFQGSSAQRCTASHSDTVRGKSTEARSQQQYSDGSLSLDKHPVCIKRFAGQDKGTVCSPRLRACIGACHLRREVFLPTGSKPATGPPGAWQARLPNSFSGVLSE